MPYQCPIERAVDALQKALQHLEFPEKLIDASCFNEEPRLVAAKSLPDDDHVRAALAAAEQAVLDLHTDLALRADAAKRLHVWRSESEKRRLKNEEVNSE